MPFDSVILKTIVFGIFMPLLFIFMIGVVIFDWIVLVTKITFLAIACIFILPDRIYTMTVEILNEVLERGE